MTSASRVWAQRALTAGLALAVTATPVLTGIVGAPAASAAAAYPADSKLTPVSRPAMARPGYLTPVKDPTFGTTITRVSDQTAFGSTYTWPRNTYSTNQAWNSDGSRMVLGYGDPGWLLDGKTYKYSGQRLSGTGKGVWSNTNPDTFYAVSGNQFLRKTVSTGASTVLRTFTGYSNLTIGNEEGSPSNDDRTIALVASGSGGTTVLSYDPIGNTIVGSKTLSSSSSLDWAASSQSGKYIILSFGPDGSSAGTGVDLYDRSMNYVRHLYNYSEHADMGYDSAGNEAYVTIDYTAGASENRMHLTSIRLTDGVATTVLRTDWVGTHVSCRNIDRPGWCYVSDAVADRPSRVTGGYDEVFAVKLDGSGTVQRFAHAHQSAGISYEWQSMAVPSRDGSRVLFSNDWGMGSGTPSYAYVAGLPATTTTPTTTPTTAPVIGAAPSGPAPTAAPAGPAVPASAPTTQAPRPATTTAAPAPKVTPRQATPRPAPGRKRVGWLQRWWLGLSLHSGLIPGAQSAG
jgi:hypothetical protein